MKNIYLSLVALALCSCQTNPSADFGIGYQYLPSRGSDVQMLYFDENLLQMSDARRDDLSIETGEIDSYSKCNSGNFCAIFSEIPTPIVIFLNRNTLAISDYIYNAANTTTPNSSCTEYSAISESNLSQLNYTYCPKVGVTEIRVLEGNSERLKLSLRTFYGLAHRVDWRAR